MVLKLHRFALEPLSWCLAFRLALYRKHARDMLQVGCVVIIHKLVLLRSTCCYSHLMTGAVTVVPKSQLGTWMMIQNEKRASKYLVTWIFEALLPGMSFDQLHIYWIFTKDARAWLEVYAETFGEQNPMSLTVYLPPGRKAFYHATYIYDRTLVLMSCCING